MRLPCLIGTKGHFIGEIHPLRFGRAITVGRSRSADISIKRTRPYRDLAEDERENDKDAQTVSSLHFQITLNNMYNIELRNIGQNGTKVDGKRVELIVLKDVMRHNHVISFGTAEEFSLEMRDVDEE